MLDKDKRHKTYKTTEHQIITSFNKYMEDKISTGEMKKFWEDKFKR